jgi:hypothetical protein
MNGEPLVLAHFSFAYGGLLLPPRFALCANSHLSFAKVGHPSTRLRLQAVFEGAERWGGDAEQAAAYDEGCVYGEGDG